MCIINHFPMPDKQTILIVDDEEDLLDLIEYNLKKSPI
jgi:DNA-binding NtrC family response regulator